MGLTHSRRAKKYHILTIFQKAHGGQLVDLALVDGGLEGEIEGGPAKFRVNDKL